MLYCPKCKSEYKEGNTVCYDCKEPLLKVEEPSEEKQVEVIASEPVCIVRGIDSRRGDAIVALLTDVGITAFAKNLGSGDYMQLYMGFSIFGQDIYVAKIDYERAKEIVDGYMAEPDDTFEEQALESVENEEDMKTFSFPTSGVARAILAGILIVVIIVLFGVFI